jgi:formylglycine-generating enzyme required for sulfatase activity
MTPYYTTPESFRGKIAKQSDQYSLAMTYYHLRTGQVLFGGGLEQVMCSHLMEQPNLAALLPAEQAVVARALSKEPEQRWPSCEAFVAELRGQIMGLSELPKSVDNSKAIISPRKDAILVMAVFLCAAVCGVMAIGLFSRNATGTKPMEPKSTGLTPTKSLTGQEPARLTAPFSQKDAKEAQTAWAKYLGREVEEEIDLGGGVILELVLIPPGTFTMGSPDGEKEHSADEVAHTVAITRPFYLGKYTVTQQQYEKIVGKNPSSVKVDDPSQFPVETVSWDDAETFCKKVTWGKSTLALPREAEWEYACRAGTQTPFHFGEENNGNECNCNGNYPFGTENKGPRLGQTREVRAYAANGFGLYQMHGNVDQWCADYYGPYWGMSEKDPVQLKSRDTRRVLRGGSWYDNSRYCRAAHRYAYDPSFLSGGVGFRVCARLN